MILCSFQFAMYRILEGIQLEDALIQELAELLNLPLCLFQMC